jgi:hypothetical protein
VTKSVLVLSDRAVNACQSAAPTVGMQSSPCPWHPAYSHKGDVPFMGMPHIPTCYLPRTHLQ